MAKRKPAWTSILPQGTRLADFTLDELRNFKRVHALLVEQHPGPPAISYLVQSFRFLQMFAIASIVEDKATPLQRASSELEQFGLHQDIGRTKKAAKLRELFTTRTVSAFPSVEEHTRGEIFLTRLIHIHGQVFLFGNPHGFPADSKENIEDMILDKLFYFPGASTNAS